MRLPLRMIEGCIMFRSSVGFCILVACITTVVADADRPLAENPYALDSEKSCGPMCVGFLDRHFGGTRHYSEIASLCPPGALGINLESAEAALQKLGYHTRIVRLTAESLRTLQWPCIIHEENGAGLGHFVVCIRWQPDHGTFQLYSPPMSLDEAKFETLKQRMGTAIAIVVSPTPLPPANELVPMEWSWQFMLGTEAIVIGILLLVFSRTSTNRTSTKKTQAAAKRVAVSILAIALPLAGCHQSTPTDPQVSNDGRTIDLGQVLQGTNLESTFCVRNNSNSPFRIDRIERTCQCQDIRFDAQQDVSPQGETFVTAVVPTSNHVGPIQIKFIVHTMASDKSHATIDLMIKANVRVPLRAIPSEVMFGSFSDTALTRQLRIEAEPPELVSKYTSVTAPDFCNVKLLTRDRSGLLFTVQLSPEAPKGALNGSISLKFDHREFPVLNVPVRGQKTGPIHVVPAKLRVNGRATEQTLQVLVASTTGQPFRLLSTSPPGGATPIWEETNVPQKRYLIKILFTNPQAVDGKTIVINTDLPEEPSIHIPISVRDLP